MEIDEHKVYSLYGVRFFHMGKYELSLHANVLKNVAGKMGTSDPFAVVTSGEGARAHMLGKTEECLNNLSPRWFKVITFDFEPGNDSRLIVTAYAKTKRRSTRTMGAAVFKVQEILQARAQTQSNKFQKGGNLFANVR